MPAAEIRDLVGNEIWEEYFKFTVVRNPYAKLVSAWYHFYKPALNPIKRLVILGMQPSSLPQLFTEERDIFDFRAWIRRGGSVRDRNKYLIDGEVCVDFFIRQEHLFEDLKKVNTILGIHKEGNTLPRLKTNNRTTNYNISQFYDNKTEQIVRQMYDWEFERFGYEMPVGNPSS